MKAFISDYYPEPTIITPDDGYHYFFGYYDLPAEQKGRHLCHRVAFMDRLPEADDIAELGWLENGEFHKFAETTAWNFQQGALLQWHGTKPDTVCYNVCENGRFSTVTHHLPSGEKRYTDRAAATLSADGNWGIGVDFGRIYDFRPGYGYAGWKDPYADCNAPAEDGAFLIDRNSGRSRQIIDYKTLAPLSGFTETQKVLINHVNFSPASDRFVMLVRNFREEGKMWSTSLVLSDLEGNLRVILQNTMVSHYHWKNEAELLVYCEVAGKRSVYCIHLDNGHIVEYDMGREKNPDIHCCWSPDYRRFIGDGYPVDGYRPLMAYDMETGEWSELFRAFSVKPDIIDIRCDLHARFIQGGKFISFDTTHNNKRQIAVIPNN
ncbi:MAG: hypothetical protein IJC46_06655 [Clostridia bacterium]|nr:hypothetical protein [Clostridia bacterium]